jgi:hypothetical protein
MRIPNPSQSNVFHVFDQEYLSTEDGWQIVRLHGCNGHMHVNITTKRKLELKQHHVAVIYHADKKVEVVEDCNAYRRCDCFLDPCGCDTITFTLEGWYEEEGGWYSLELTTLFDNTTY